MNALKQHIEHLQACTLCPGMQRPPVSCGPVVSKVMLVGQAPGDKEPRLQKPFAWTAGRTLFQWFTDSSGIDETRFRSHIYIAAVCRCFPGKKPRGGDRVPSHEEIANCARWLTAEMRLLKPELIIPVGKLAISQFLKYRSLEECVGRRFRCSYADHECDAIPLPHPSGASPWPRIEPGKTLLAAALALIAEHPAITAFRRHSPVSDRTD